MSRISNGQSGNESLKLAPHSGVQFLVYAFDLDKTGRFSRSFIEHRRMDLRAADGVTPIELRPNWNDDDPELDPPFPPQGNDEVYEISKQKALEPFLGRWTPVPYLAVQAARDQYGRELLQTGPSNWARVMIAAEPDAVAGVSHRVILAFDTELMERSPGRAYVAPSPSDARGEHEFVFASLFRDIAAFISDSGAGAHGGQEWVSRWIDEAFVEFKTAQRGRAPRPEDRQPLEHAARYVAFLQFLAEALPPPRIKLIDTLSAEPLVRPVDVDLVLDIGNSRTCGMLIESFPNQEKVEFGNSFILQLRDLEQPWQVYAEPFDSDVQLAQAQFGKEYLSRFSTRTRAFFWPSLVRVGPEAARYRQNAEGTEGASGMSSPKRYLCDVDPVNQEWRFQPGDYGANREPPTIDLKVRRFVNYRGDVLRQVADEQRFYERLSHVPDRAELAKPAGRLSFSRSSFFTFLVAEILIQTLSLINNPQLRATRGEKDTPRRLRRMILTLPTAMPVREQRLLRSRASAAVKLVFDMMGWTESPPPGLLIPEVHAAWDEASCVQFVYFYSEIAQKFGGAIGDFMKLAGRPRPFVEPENPPATPPPPQPSIRVASLDIGGGTTDLMITTYYVEDNRAIVPVQTFREGFRIAGEDILHETILQALLPAIEADLKARGLAQARELLIDRFGADRANMTEPEKHLRGQLVARVMKRAALAMLSAYENAPTAWAISKESATIGELVARANPRSGTPAGAALAYFDAAAAAWGAKEFRLVDVSVPIDFARLKNAVETTLGAIFDNIAEALHHFDCDVVLLSGRPSCLPATVDLLVNKLALSPDRILPLSSYSAGNWYPFGGRSRFRIEDPKTATVVGCMLCALAESQITNFTLYTHRLAMRSTANYIGMMERDGKIRAENVFFSAPDLARGGALGPQSGEVVWYAPTLLGARQLPIERWVASPLYRVKLTAGAGGRAIQRPVTVTLERELPEELADYESREFSSKEAQKEELRIADATARDGALVTRSFTLTFDTLGNEQGYWLDTGILALA
ncbi:virulence factor SrfB [Methylocapsa acidiphila]|uniref:virulence factor SrfB n=1 Tax=Methylocapsa acidiphila TaxID=133552 RepID=UPI0003F9676F|nr:virulence factor SrfB [Methylocapsa acidiphila]